MRRPRLNRRKFIRSLSRTALVLPFADIMALAAPPQQHAAAAKDRPAGTQLRREAGSAAARARSPRSRERRLGVSFTDVVHEAGLAVKTIYGGEKTNKYLLETTGCGLAFYDYDADGWLDHLPRQWLAARRLSRRAGTSLSSLQEQSRWHVYRCDRRLRPRTQDRLGPGLLRRRLQQRRPR